MIRGGAVPADTLLRLLLLRRRQRQLMNPLSPLHSPPCPAAAACRSPRLDPLGLASISPLQHTFDATPQLHDACSSSSQPQGSSSRHCESPGCSRTRQPGRGNGGG